MNKGYIKRIGSETVDVQLSGSAASLTNVRISGQIDASTLTIGGAVLVDIVNGEHVVLHTLANDFRSPATAIAASSAGVIVTNNALLADGSVPLTGNLPVTPGVTIDGYDISVLGQTIDNLQAADSVARTGHTVLTHASHLVATIGPDDTELLIRHGIFSDKETLVVSNTSGEVEFMRVVGNPVAAVDDRGALCYLYTVTRRTATNPTGIVIGWAAATLVNGLTHKGYISVDARENSVAAPNLRFVMHTDIDAGATEQIVRIGNVRGILGNGDDDFGFAAGRLNTGDRYFSYNYNRNLLALRGADISISDDAGVEVFRVWGVAENDHDTGNTRIGKASGGHIETRENRVDFYAGSQRIMYISPIGARFKGMVWSGDQPGPQVGIGEENGQGLIAARNAAGVGQFVVRTGDENVHVHIGNPIELGGYSQFANGEWTTDGIVRARAFELLGGGTIGSGVILANAGKFTAGTGNNVAVIDGEDIAWRIYAGHASPASAPFRVNQAGEVWLDNAHVAGVIQVGGTAGGWTIASDYLVKDTGVANTSAGLAPLDYPFYAGATYVDRASAPFRVTPAGALTASNATITGTINATAGNFTGSVYVGASAPRIHIDGVNKRIESTNFASGTSGFRIEGATGNAEFNDVDVRGSLRVAVLQYGHVLATNGSIWVTPVAGKTIASFTTIDSSTWALDTGEFLDTGLYLSDMTFTISVEDPAGMTHAAAGSLWVVNDIVRVQEPLVNGTVADIWAIITAKTDMSTYWLLTVRKESPGAGLNYTFTSGATVLNYKQSGAGLVRITADASNSPYISIATHAGSPWSTITERARLGNLTGINNASGYGLWTDNGYFTGTVNASAGSIAGWTITSGHLYAGSNGNRVGMLPAIFPFYAGSENSGLAPFRVSSTGVLTASNADITGKITASTGNIAGWTINSTYLAKDTGTNNTSAGMSPTDYPFYAGATYANRATASFRVTAAGALTASAGNIAGWTMAETKLYWEDTDNYRGIGMANYNDTDGWAFWAGDHRPAYAEFRVSKNGALWATTADITGTITANAGSIGGFTISSTEGLFSGSGVTRVQMKPGSGFWAGATAVGDAPFSVSSAGTLKATNVNITAGGGSVLLSNSGLRLNYSKTNASYITWYESNTTLKGYIGCYLENSMSTITISPASGQILLNGIIRHSGSSLGFMDAAPTTKQTVTGSRGGNAALASLLTALSSYGLITDSTTA